MVHLHPDHEVEPLPALRRRLLVVGLVLLLLGALLTALVTWDVRLVQPVDDAFLRLMEAARWGPLVAVSKALSALFGTAVLWPVRAVVTLVIALRRHWLSLSAWICAVVLSEAVIGPV